MGQREGVVNMREVPEETWEEGKFGGRDQDLGGAAGSFAVGLRRTVIPPGKQSFPRHAHMAEEEIFFVVRGRGRSCGAMNAWRTPSWPTRAKSWSTSP
jgi:uncharacterized cupin superfamily protein